MKIRTPKLIFPWKVVDPYPKRAKISITEVLCASCIDTMSVNIRSYRQMSVRDLLPLSAFAFELVAKKIAIVSNAKLLHPNPFYIIFARI